MKKQPTARVSKASLLSLKQLDTRRNAAEIALDYHHAHRCRLPRAMKAYGEATAIGSSQEDAHPEN